MGFLAILVVIFFRVFTGDIAEILMNTGRFTNLEFIYHAGRWLSVDNWNAQLLLSVPFILMIVYFGSVGEKLKKT
jgi:hypothetical protein